MSHRHLHVLFCLVVLLSTVGTVHAEQSEPRVWSLDAAASRVTVSVGRAGLFGFVGHPHEVVADSVAGHVRWDPEDPASASVLIRGTDGGDAPFFSADGQSVGFRAQPGSVLKRVSVLGGPAVTITDPDQTPQGASWGQDDTIVFGSPTGLMRVPAAGGEPLPLTAVDPEQGETAHRWPDVLPNGKGVLFTAWSASDEDSRLAVVSLETGTVTYLLSGGSHPRYAPTGHIVYAVGGTLRAVGFDPDRLALTSNNATPVVEDVSTTMQGAGNFSIAENGSIVYVMGVGAGGGAQRSLVWVDRAGDEEPLQSPLLAYQRPRVSPDGTRVAVDVADPEGAVDQATYERQRDKLREDVALAKLELHEAELEEMDVEGVLAFAEHLLTNAARLWMEASLDQKQRLQTVFFPAGLQFDGERFGTAVTCLAFKQLGPDEAVKDGMASPTGFNPFTVGGAVPRVA